ncbi:MAG TPA: exonuclease subunit SbcD [Spirochaetota bacterium]|nr:exonuclease subunit SbcD [Spirochaetota bacterium]
MNSESIKILHTSDWHLGKQLNGYPRHAEQIEVMEEICSIAENESVDAVIISGDIFDTVNPPIESTELLYSTLKKLSNGGRRAVIAIAGNHDSPDRIEAPDALARECGIIFSGYPNSLIRPFELDTGLKITESDQGFISLALPGKTIPLRILLTPYANEIRLKTYLGEQNSEEELRTVLMNKWNETALKYCDTKGVNILAAHLLFMNEGGDIPDEGDDEKPILHIGGAQAVFSKNIPPQIQYTAAGHLHRKQILSQETSPIVYSGSPIAYSFGESDQIKYAVIADIKPSEKAVIKYTELTKGKKLLRGRFESTAEAVKWLSNNSDALVELTMATETFLSAEERKCLYAAYDGISALIPEVADKNELSNNAKVIDLQKSIEDLFLDYFFHRENIQPSDDIISLFKEVIAEEIE